MIRWRARSATRGHYDAVSLLDELGDDVAADVAGAAEDADPGHDGMELSRPARDRAASNGYSTVA
jgi:hypothetical protein